MNDEDGLDYAGVFAATPDPCLVLTCDLIIREANHAYLNATGRERDELVGKHLFETFPVNPEDPQGDGVANLRASLQRARDSGRPDTMALQKYDIPVAGTDAFVERWWSPVNVPIPAEDGSTRLLLHRVQDVTDFVRKRTPGGVERPHPGGAEEDESELFARARELEELHARLREVGERERRRWALELHDQTLQGLGALRGLLAAAREHGDADALRRTVDVSLDVLSDEIGKLRHLIVELRPAELDELGLKAALEELVRRASALDDFDVRLRVRLGFESGGAPERLVPDLEIAVYRVVQEALTNVARHADARHVDVRVVEHDGTVHAIVADDGGGFDMASTPKGLGLSGMHERGELAGGTVTLRSGPGAGTRVQLTAPAVHRTPASPDGRP